MRSIPSPSSRLLAITIPLILSLSLFIPGAATDPIWPSPVDEIEELMFHIKDFKTRNFADTILPCTNEASGPGRQNAAEWLRVGFHDMSTANVSSGVGGLDGSIQYQLDNGENLGPGFETTLRFMSGFLTSRSSLADLIALGVYASVRSCGGPAVPIRVGRIDAKGPGPLGVPQPEHSVEMFREQFLRMGFTNEEMIQATACGHTIGGVHDTEFPELVVHGEAPSDTTVAGFDEKVVTEYLSGDTANPLVVGPAVALGKDSDTKIFNSDGNVTVKAMSEPATFQSVCQKVLQKMIDVVPAGVQLSDPLEPYMVKPVDLHLTLNRGAYDLLFTGLIRVRTTNLPTDEILNVTIEYRDRYGGDSCYSGNCRILATLHGVGYGLDDSFGFYPIEAVIPASSGISSFIIQLDLKNDTTLLFDNNGHSYLVQDAILLQQQQSCLVQHTGSINVVAAVRNDRTDLPATLAISYKMPREGLPVAGLHDMTMSMKKGDCVGHYTFYSAQWTIPGGISFSSRIDVISGEGSDALSDNFNRAVELPGMCLPFSGSPAACTAVMMIPPTPTTTKDKSVATTLHTHTVPSSTPFTTALSNPVKLEGGGMLGDLGAYQTAKGFMQYWINYFVDYFFV